MALVRLRSSDDLFRNEGRVLYYIDHLLINTLQARFLAEIPKQNASPFLRIIETFTFLLFSIDKNMHFCYVLGIGFMRNHPIDRNLPLAGKSNFGVDYLTCGRSNNKGVTK